MLGKTARGIYWMFRYLERSENTARLVEAGLRMALTRPDSAEDEWASVVETAGVRPGYTEKHGRFEASGVVNYLLRDPANPSSVMSAMSTARSNARLVRTALTREVWEATNESWITLKDLLAQPVSTRALPDALSAIRHQGALVRGALHGTMLRNDIYDFARIGTFLERADNTARIIDVKYYVLLPTAMPVGSSLDNVQWDTILRSVSGQRAYRWMHGGDVNALGIADFVILDRRMPRSLAFCYAKLVDNLGYLEQDYGVRHPCHDMAENLRATLDEGDINAIFDAGLHEFLQDFKDRNNALGSQIEQDYRFYG